MSRCRATMCPGPTQRRGARDHHPVRGRDRAARLRAGAEGKRGAVPADRQFGAGDDVGDPARPRPRLRQRGLCRFRLRPGCDLEEARTLDWRARIHPDDVERIVAESIAGEASLQRFTLEGRYRRHDGEYRWLRSVSQPRFGAGRGAGRVHRGRQRHHAGQGGRARASAPGRRADRAAGGVGGAVPRGVRGGARGDGAARARRHRAWRSTTGAKGVARTTIPARRVGPENVGRADHARPIRNISRR